MSAAEEPPSHRLLWVYRVSPRLKLLCEPQLVKCEGNWLHDDPPKMELLSSLSFWESLTLAPDILELSICPGCPSAHGSSASASQGGLFIVFGLVMQNSEPRALRLLSKRLPRGYITSPKTGSSWSACNLELVSAQYSSSRKAEWNRAGKEHSSWEVGLGAGRLLRCSLEALFLSHNC